MMNTKKSLFHGCLVHTTDIYKMQKEQKFMRHFYGYSFRCGCDKVTYTKSKAAKPLPKQEGLCCFIFVFPIVLPFILHC